MISDPQPVVETAHCDVIACPLQSLGQEPQWEIIELGGYKHGEDLVGASIQSIQEISQLLFGRGIAQALVPEPLVSSNEALAVPRSRVPPNLCWSQPVGIQELQQGATNLVIRIQRCRILAILKKLL